MHENKVHLVLTIVYNLCEIYVPHHQLFDKIPKRVSLCFCELCYLLEL